MDLISDALMATRTGGSVFATVSAAESWELACAGPPVAAFHIIARGACRLRLHDSGHTFDLGPHDLILIPRGNAHSLFDRSEAPTTPVQDLIARLSDDPIGRGSLGTGPETTTLICGVYNYSASGPHPLMRDLPTALHIEAKAASFDLQSAVAMFVHEASKAELGSLTIVNRLADVILVHALRRWIQTGGDDQTPGLLTALADPIITDVLTHMHQQPERPWTANSLAASVGASPSTLKKRFRAVVGEPQAAYLRRHRLDLAARLLRERRLALAEIVTATGYGSEAAFSRAFSAHHGTSPGRYRSQQRDIASITHPT